jgi:hypothetical protein
MSSNSGTGIHRLLPQNFFGSVNDFLTNNKTLDFFMHRGTNDIPYGFMAISTVAVGAFTYVTYTDYANEISTGISETLDNLQSNELFNASTQEETDNPFDLNIPNIDNSDQEPQDIILGEEEKKPEEEEEEAAKKTEQEEAAKKTEQEEAAKKTEQEEAAKKTEQEEAAKKTDKKEEPGEQFKMGGKKKRKRRKTAKKKKKSQN